MKKRDIAGVLITVLIVLAFMFISGIGCPIKYCTGISCPGCGMTRALWSAIHFEFQKAFYYHPLYWIVPIGGIFYLFQHKISKRNLNRVWYSLAFLFLVVHIIRMIFFQNEVVVFQPSQNIFFKMGKEILK